MTDGRDRRYCLQRAAEEANKARELEDPVAAAVHERLAKLYLDRAEATADEHEK